MKKIFYLACVILGFISCKKDRICTCKVVDKTSSSAASKYDITYTMHNVTKSTAKTNCIDYEIKDESTGETITYDCFLKK